MITVSGGSNPTCQYCGRAANHGSVPPAAGKHRGNENEAASLDLCEGNCFRFCHSWFLNSRASGTSPFGSHRFGPSDLTFWGRQGSKTAPTLLLKQCEELQYMMVARRYKMVDVGNTKRTVNTIKTMSHQLTFAPSGFNWEDGALSFFCFFFFTGVILIWIWMLVCLTGGAVTSQSTESFRRTTWALNCSFSASGTYWGGFYLRRRWFRGCVEDLKEHCRCEDAPAWQGAEMSPH